jgi:hypothetical protein
MPWYLADVVLELSIEDDPRNVVHVNTVLIEGDSPETAYDKAMTIGMASEQEYLNTADKIVRIQFHGLRELRAIHDELGDGAEVAYEESVAVPAEQLRQWVLVKEQLRVFAPVKDRSDSPNYMPR